MAVFQVVHKATVGGNGGVVGVGDSRKLERGERLEIGRADGWGRSGHTGRCADCSRRLGKCRGRRGLCRGGAVVVAQREERAQLDGVGVAGVAGVADGKVAKAGGVGLLEATAPKALRKRVGDTPLNGV